MTSSGRAIGYEERGDGSRTPIVFLHGVGSDKSVWHPQLDHFSQERRSIAFDYPGYGDSEPAPDGTTRDDFASAIRSALQQLSVDRAHVCGLSLGGVVAIALHHLAPGACASLILADTFAVHPEGRAIYERSRQSPRAQWIAVTRTPTIPLPTSPTRRTMGAPGGCVQALCVRTLLHRPLTPLW